MTNKKTEDDAELLIESIVQDHITLAHRSNIVRFRDGHVGTRLYESGHQTQFILEEIVVDEPQRQTSNTHKTIETEEDQQQVSHKRKLLIKQLHNRSYALDALRTIYSIMCFLLLGFFLVFCLEVILTLVLDLALKLGRTTHSEQVQWVASVGIILAIFLFVDGLADALTMLWMYARDAYDGSHLVKTFFISKSFFDAVVVDWLFFLAFLFIPALAMSVSLYTGSHYWWDITSLVWIAGVGLFALIFAISAVWFEVHQSYRLIKYNIMTSKGNEQSFFKVVRVALLLQLRRAYSGCKQTTYVADNGNYSLDEEACDEPVTPGETNDDIPEDKAIEKNEHWMLRVWLGPWSYLTTTSIFRALGFKVLDKPKPIVNVDDLLGYYPLVTKDTWSLEKLFFRRQSARYIAIIDGEDKLTERQIFSSLICSILGIVIMALIATSLLVWLQLSVSLVGLAALVFALAFGRTVRSLFRVSWLFKKLLNERNGDSNDTEDAANQQKTKADNRGVFLVSKIDRISEPSDTFCFVMFFLEFLVRYVYPIVMVCILSTNIAWLLILISIVMILRRIFDLVSTVEEAGKLGVATDDSSSRNTRNDWLSHAKLTTVVDKLAPRHKQVWRWPLRISAVILIAILLWGRPVDEESTKSTYEGTVTILDDFVYEAAEMDMRYPTCDLGSFNTTFDKQLNMLDFVFLSGLPYLRDDLIAGQLDGWFGNMTVADEQDLLDSIEKELSFKNKVHYKLFNLTMPGGATAGVVSIRGTHKLWDVLVDSQLWLAAILSQALRATLPLGDLFTPILDELVYAINVFIAGTADKETYYTATTEFVKKAKQKFDVLFLTGHSLGGGLAMISGAQTQTPAISLSGPNAKISGRSLNPSVTHEQLNRFTFNIQPDHDFVAYFDDVSDQHQKIRCTADENEYLLGKCHDQTRSFCEVLTTCGSQNRPVICECHMRYGYPKPLPSPGTTRTFEEACGIGQ